MKILEIGELQEPKTKFGRLLGEILGNHDDTIPVHVQINDGNECVCDVTVGVPEELLMALGGEVADGFLNLEKKTFKLNEEK